MDHWTKLDDKGRLVRQLLALHQGDVVSAERLRQGEGSVVVPGSGTTKIRLLAALDDLRKLVEASDLSPFTPEEREQAKSAPVGWVPPRFRS